MDNTLEGVDVGLRRGKGVHSRRGGGKGKDAWGSKKVEGNKVGCYKVVGLSSDEVSGWSVGVAAVVEGDVVGLPWSLPRYNAKLLVCT